jgi:hypothetical protein
MRPGYLMGFVALILAAVLPIVVRWSFGTAGPGITVVQTDGREMIVSARVLGALTELCRRGSYENQFGNWRDDGEYCGIHLADLIGWGTDYSSIRVVAEDGYRIEIERRRVEDSEYPMVLATSFDGQSVPGWSDGYRIAVLPEDGGVSNADYRTDSAGSYWVKNVARIELLP